MKNKILIISFFVVFCLSFGGGIFLGKILFYSKNNPNDTYQAGWKAAKKRLADTGAFQEISKSLEIKSISGIVKQIKDNFIIIESTPIEPLSDPNLDERLIEINKNTKYIAVVKKSEQQYQKELGDALKSGNLNDNPSSPDGGVKMYYNEDSSIDQLLVGIQITVFTDENIRDKKQFTAKEIFFGK